MLFHRENVSTLRRLAPQPSQTSAGPGLLPRLCVRHRTVCSPAASRPHQGRAHAACIASRTRRAAMERFPRRSPALRGWAPASVATACLGLLGVAWSAGAPAGSVAGGSHGGGRPTGQRGAYAVAAAVVEAGGGAGRPRPRAGVPAPGRAPEACRVSYTRTVRLSAQPAADWSVWRLVRHRGGLPPLLAGLPGISCSWGLGAPKPLPGRCAPALRVRWVALLALQPHTPRGLRSLRRAPVWGVPAPAHPALSPSSPSAANPARVARKPHARQP